MMMIKWLLGLLLMSLCLMPGDPAFAGKKKAAVQKKAPEKISAPAINPKKNGWQSMFDGKTLSGWTSVKFGGEGTVGVTNGMIRLGLGEPFTAVVWTGEVIRINYEIELEARRVDGTDFFCGLTVPFKDSYCSLIVGGWGGGMIGISSIDDFDASENETSLFREFDNNRWYKIRLQMTDTHIRAWMDAEQIIDEDVEYRKVSLRAGEIELCVPLGIASWSTAGDLRNIRIRTVTPKEE